MAGEWIGVVGTLLGVTAGGLVTLYVTERQLKHQEEQQNKQNNLHRYENISRLLSKIKNQTAILNTNLVMNRTHGVAIQAEKLGGEVPFSELHMLVNFYAPSLIEKVNAIDTEFKALGNYVADAIMTDDNSDEKSKEIILGATQRTTNLSGLVDSAQTELNDLVVKYRDEA